MNLPNKLTMFRVILIPFFVLFMLADVTAYDKWIALAVFIIASLTDLLDGYIARKYNLVTNFGKFMDPLADKLLVCSALICLVALSRIPAWIVIVIIAREFIISGFRLIAAEKGKVIAASMWGKWKTTFQMVMLCVKMLVLDSYLPVTSSASVIISMPETVLRIIGDVTMYIALILTVVSLVDYLMKNKDVLKDVD